jgi:hypothetical protein
VTNRRSDNHVIIKDNPMRRSSCGAPRQSRRHYREIVARMDAEAAPWADVIQKLCAEAKIEPQDLMSGAVKVDVMSGAIKRRHRPAETPRASANAGRK